jgi:NAD(P)-dependent dehydrogenase (short-subunit alcohol dehydrogenase family)
MEGKIAMVTGATAGIGKATALEIARKGAATVIVGRDREKSVSVTRMIRQETGNPTVDFLIADLSSIAQTTVLADQFKERYDRLDVLVNNVGAMYLSRGETVDGIERTFALNHLVGYFLLTNLLLDRMKATAPARVVTVASDSHFRGEIHFGDPELKRGYNPMKAYSQSKLADVMFTYSLARRLEGSGITANALHPGFVASNFLVTNNAGWTSIVRKIMNLFARSEAQGADTSVYLATSPAVERVTGKYFEDRREKRSSKTSYVVEDQQRLWKMSEQMLRDHAPDQVATSFRFAPQVQSV